MNPPVVCNKHYEEFDVYIGRGSLYGNPFVIGEDGDRNQVIRKYRVYLWNRIRLGKTSISDVLSLEGKRLGCFCSPKPCHGDVLVNAFNFFKEKELTQELHQ